MRRAADITMARTPARTDWCAGRSAVPPAGRNDPDVEPAQEKEEPEDVARVLEGEHEPRVLGDQGADAAPIVRDPASG